MNILERIVQDKKIEVEQRLGGQARSEHKGSFDQKRVPLSLDEALKAEGLSVIAEVKKASPSKGVIREDFKPVDFALSYQNSGAAAISVLTEEKYFQGHPDYLKDIKKSVAIPVLRKDFIVDERQIEESFLMGADAILLIVAVLDKKQLATYLKLAQGFGLSVLVEAHTETEVDQALEAGATILGINNRNLTTFKTDLTHSIRLGKRIPDDVIKVSESGINTKEDCKLLLDHGFDAVLVGESLMRNEDPGSGIPTLLELCG